MPKNGYNSRHSVYETNADSNATLPQINSTNFSVTPSLLSLKGYQSAKKPNYGMDYSTRGIYGALAYGGTKIRQHEHRKSDQVSSSMDMSSLRPANIFRNQSSQKFTNPTQHFPQNDHTIRTLGNLKSDHSPNPDVSTIVQPRGMMFASPSTMQLSSVNEIVSTTRNR
jgi:hypothetical protein